MTVTRANVEAILVKRTGALMTKAGLAVTVVGSNADLNDPIGWALRRIGLTVITASLVTDADLASVTDAQLDEFLDLAEYRTLESVLGNLAAVDTKLGPRDEKLSQLASQIEKKLTRLAKGLEAEYGYGIGTLSVGVLTYDFAEHGEAASE